MEKAGLTMKGFKRLAIVGAVALLTSNQASAAVINLFDYAFNIDGAVSNPTLGDPLLGGVNVGSFDSTTGLGTITYTIGGTGSHYASLFVDHEVDESINTFFNEQGSVAGSAAAGQSWEIDEPGQSFGDIYTKFSNSSLDNSIGTVNPEDVSMAMGWDFILAAGETATINFTVAELMPASGFYLTHFDADSNASLYLFSNLTISGGGTQVPEPGSLALVSLGLFGLWRSRRQTKAGKDAQ
jgi:hypothetical protein